MGGNEVRFGNNAFNRAIVLCLWQNVGISKLGPTLSITVCQQKLLKWLWLSNTSQMLT